MRRRILATVLALASWLVVATALDVALRTAWPDYRVVERSLTFTLGMQLARLAIGALASLAAGFVASRIAPLDRLPAWIAGLGLLALFVPEHIRLGAALPLWYHLAFLVTLLPLVLLGDWLGRAGRSDSMAAAG